MLCFLVYWCHGNSHCGLELLCVGCPTQSFVNCICIHIQTSRVVFVIESQSIISHYTSIAPDIPNKPMLTEKIE